MTSSAIVSLDSVSKDFVVRHEHSLKERLMSGVRGRTTTERFRALDGVTLDVPVGTTLGLVGHNGSGKSTLLKVVGGIIRPTSGTALRRGRLAALLELGAGFHQDLTGRENIYLNAAVLGLSRQDTDRHIDAIIDFSGVEDFIDTQVKFYSSGMYVRLAFAVAVHVDPDLLLVDEVLAVGDEPFQIKCMRRIRDFQAEGRTIVLVSHSAEQVASVCNQAAVLESGRLTFHGDTQLALAELRAQYVRRGRDGARQRAGERSIPLTIETCEARVEGKGAKSELVVAMQVAAHYDIEDWNTYLSIDSASGVRVYALDRRPVGHSATAGSVWTIEQRLSNVGLGSGQYIVNVGVGEVGEAMCNSIAGAVSVQWMATGEGSGLVSMAPRVVVARDQ